MEITLGVRPDIKCPKCRTVFPEKEWEWSVAQRECDHEWHYKVSQEKCEYGCGYIAPFVYGGGNTPI